MAKYDNPSARFPTADLSSNYSSFGILNNQEGQCADVLSQYLNFDDEVDPRPDLLLSPSTSHCHAPDAPNEVIRNQGNSNEIGPSWSTGLQPTNDDTTTIYDGSNQSVLDESLQSSRPLKRSIVPAGTGDQVDRLLSALHSQTPQTQHIPTTAGYQRPLLDRQEAQHYAMMNKPIQPQSPATGPKSTNRPPSLDQSLEHYWSTLRAWFERCAFVTSKPSQGGKANVQANLDFCEPLCCLYLLSFPGRMPEENTIQSLAQFFKFTPALVQSHFKSILTSIGPGSEYNAMVIPSNKRASHSGLSRCECCDCSKRKLTETATCSKSFPSHEFLCSKDSCGRAWKDKSAWVRHERTHQNAEKWKCRFGDCSRRPLEERPSYGRRDHLLDHIRKHHPEVDKAKCDIRECREAPVQREEVIYCDQEGCQSRLKDLKERNDHYFSQHVRMNSAIKKAELGHNISRIQDFDMKSQDPQSFGASSDTQSDERDEFDDINGSKQFFVSHKIGTKCKTLVTPQWQDGSSAQNTLCSSCGSRKYPPSTLSGESVLRSKRALQGDQKYCVKQDDKA